jgi:hypothetical protein
MKCKGGDNEDEQVARGWTCSTRMRYRKYQCPAMLMANVIIVIRSHGHEDMNKGGPGRGSSSITKDDGRSHVRMLLAAGGD